MKNIFGNTFRERKTARIEYYKKNVENKKKKICGCCSGYGSYKNGHCGNCEGSGYEDAPRMPKMW